MKIIILCVWVFCLHACLHTTYLSGAHRRQQKASDSWELELQVVGRHHVGAGNQAQGLCKSSSALHTGPLQPSSLCGGPVSPLGLFIAEGLPKARPLKTKSLPTLQLLHFCLFNCIRVRGLYCGLLVHSSLLMPQSRGIEVQTQSFLLVSQFNLSLTFSS